MSGFSRAFGSRVAALLVVACASAGCERDRVAPGTHAEAQRWFDAACAKCHGRDGRGGVPAAEGLPAPRNFRDPAFQASRSDAELEHSIRSGKGSMPPFGAMFDDAQRRSLVAYIRGFNPEK